MPTGNEYRMTLSKVERTYIAELLKYQPEYEGLDPADIAHMELKDHLRAKVATLKRQSGLSQQTMNMRE